MGHLPVDRRCVADRLRLRPPDPRRPAVQRRSASPPRSRSSSERRMNHPRQRLPWYLVATGQALFVAGDVITYNYERFFGNAPPFPSIGDLFYLSVYPFLIAGVLMLVRRRSPGRDRASLIDSLIIAVGRRNAVVGVPAGAVRPRPIADAPAEVDRDGLSDHGPAPVRRRRPPRGRPREAAPGLLPDGRGRHGAVHHRHDLHADPAARVLRQHHGPPGARVGTLLPAVGRGRSSPVDGRPGRSRARGRPPTPAQTPHGARRRFADRPDRRGDPGAARRAGRRARPRRVLGACCSCSSWSG